MKMNQEFYLSVPLSEVQQNTHLLRRSPRIRVQVKAPPLGQLVPVHAGHSDTSCLARTFLKTADGATQSSMYASSRTKSRPSRLIQYQGGAAITQTVCLCLLGTLVRLSRLQDIRKVGTEVDETNNKRPER